MGEFRGIKPFMMRMSKEMADDVMEDSFDIYEWLDNEVRLMAEEEIGRELMRDNAEHKTAAEALLQKIERDIKLNQLELQRWQRIRQAMNGDIWGVTNEEDRADIDALINRQVGLITQDEARRQALMLQIAEPKPSREELQEIVEKADEDLRFWQHIYEDCNQTRNVSSYSSLTDKEFERLTLRLRNAGFEYHEARNKQRNYDG